MTNEDEISVLLRESAVGWLEGRDVTASLRGQLDVPRPVNRAQWGEMADMGWLALMLPEDLGGSGLGLPEACVLAELFGRKLVAEPFVPSVVIPSTLIAACTGEGRSMLARALAGGERVLTFAHPASPSGGAVTLSGSAISGSLESVPAIEDDGFLLVVAQDAAGKAAIVAVDAASPGIHIEKAAAGAGASLSRVRFQEATILFGGALLSGDGASAATAAAVDAGRVAVAAQLAGCAAEVLEKTIAYVGGRQQFERTIGSFQTVQHRCVDLHIGVMLARSSIRYAARVKESAERTMAAAAAKARAGEMALKAGRTAVQLHGAMGFTEEVDIGHYLRSALHLSSWLGTPTVLRRHFLSERRALESAHV
ncbi:hypothetical protein AZL_b02090 (plasmid) [Azospirillum sp. B510]|uniref:acyl-CoA dehydrogenase family protein n=1 Tax=Azospirillum sp. (strain B510) TaxID=137722 RepID=UPI0001C4CC12|nr:acyl-CoA dehydrogenase family protein [Azospirillum sp. B510]BAI74872.1 hypothetical protein AZL_b02090 [Azospirillum sp. B510]